MNFDIGGDQKAISKIAKEHYGGYPEMFEAHGWKWTGQRAMSDAGTLTVDRYGSIARFAEYHSEKPNRRLESAHEILDAYQGAWMKGFWGWSPESWGCVGYGTAKRRSTFFNNDHNTRLMFIYVTKSAELQDGAPKHQINRVVGFYLLSDTEGHRNEFQEEHHHSREPHKWIHSIKAKRAFTILDHPLPFTFDVDPIFKGKGMGTKYGPNSALLSEGAFEYLKTLTYEEVPVYGANSTGAFETSFPKIDKGPIGSRKRKQKPVSGGAPNKSGYYVKPESDSEKSLYILELIGNIDVYRGKKGDGEKIIKVGLSYSPESRKDFFNRVLPEGSYSWKIVRSTILDGHELYSCHHVAEKGERAMKEFLHKPAENHLGGEFYLATDQRISEAWRLGKEKALQAEKDYNG